MKKKNIALNILTVVVGLILVFEVWHFVEQAYHYFHPSINIGTSRPLNKELDPYYEIVGISFGFAYDFPAPRQMYKNFNELSNQTWKVDEDIVSGKYIAPTDIKVYGEIREGKTYIYYIGTATTKDGKTSDYYEALEFDFVLPGSFGLATPPQDLIK